MITTNSFSSFTAEAKVQFEETLASLRDGIRDAERMKAACQRMDEMREHNRVLFGEQNIAVELIHEARHRS